MAVDPSPAAVELIDTHCHLDREPLAGSVEAVLARAGAADVRACLAQLRATSVEALGVLTSRNARRLFGFGAARP